MLELFTNGLQLRFDSIGTYQGKNRPKTISYLLILIFGISLVLLAFQFTQIKLPAFQEALVQEDLQLSNQQLPLDASEAAKLQVLAEKTGIKAGEKGLDVKNVGEISYALLADISNSQEQQLGSLLEKGQRDLMGTIFLTLYLKRLPFILVSLLSTLILSKLLKRNVVEKQLSNGQALTMTVSLLSIPALAYLCLRGVGLNEAMALFIFVMIFVLINFFLMRQINLKGEVNHEK